jgi:hypothetical protein
MLTQTQTGVIVSADGAVAPVRSGKAGDVIVSELQPRYYEQAYRRNVFSAYAAAQATSLAGTAMVGLQLTNTSTTVNLVITKVAGNIVASSATTTSLVLAAGTGQVAAPTGQTAATRVGNNFLGGAAPQGLATAAATFSNAPVAIFPLLHNTAAIATTGVDQGFLVDFEGSIIVPPQTYVCIAAVGAAVAASGSNLAITWMEVAV